MRIRLPVVLSRRRFDALIDRIEDLEDELSIASRAHDTIAFEQVLYAGNDDDRA